MEREFDVLVIGSGSAGTSAAMGLSSRGFRVAVVDERPFGGTCVLRGCDPKKVLVTAARAIDAAKRYRKLGVVDDVPALQWTELIRFKRTFTDPVTDERLREYERAGITSLHGHAQFTDEASIDVAGDRIRAKHFVIASGAVERHVAEGDATLLTSETFMEMESLPESLLFVGGGYIAFEFAHVAARGGSRVTILHGDDRPLRGFDEDLVSHLLESTKSEGITIELNARVQRATRTADGVTLHAQTNSGDRAFQAKDGVLAAGRIPNLDSLNLQAAGVERTQKGVKVNEYLQSVGNPRVYAAGDSADAAGGLPLTPVAGSDGEVVAQNISEGNTRKTDFLGLASIVYTIPALAQIGLTQDEANRRGVEVAVHSADMSQWYGTRHFGPQPAFYKMLIDKHSGEVAGAAILGPNAEEQINVLALAMRHRIEPKDIADALYAYPTGSSDFAYMVGEALQ